MPSPEEEQLGPRFVGNRYLVEITDWDNNLHVGLSPSSAPPEARFQGGLLYVRGFEIEGRLIGPLAAREHRLRAWTLTLDPALDFSPRDDGLDRVGWLYRRQKASEDDSFTATLYLPQDAIPLTATCLAATWKYLHILTGERDQERAAITNFSFSKKIPKNLLPWIEYESSPAP
jgi:hypothetical protein